jgi:hypothetical protein
MATYFSKPIPTLFFSGLKDSTPEFFVWGFHNMCGEYNFQPVTKQ